MKVANKILSKLVEAQVKVKKLELINTGRPKPFDKVAPMKDSDFEKSKKWVGYDIPFGFGQSGSQVVYKRNLEPKKSLTITKNGFGKWVVYEYEYYGKKDKKKVAGIVGWEGFSGSVVIDKDGWKTPEEAMEAANNYYNLK